MDVNRFFALIDYINLARTSTFSLAISMKNLDGGRTTNNFKNFIRNLGLAPSVILQVEFLTEFVSVITGHTHGVHPGSKL